MFKMDGEFNREFKECGGCPEDTVGEQWKQIKVQLQGKIMEGHEVTWAWLQEKGQIPGDEKQAKLLPYLADAERAVLRELERHKAEEGKRSRKGKKKWRAALEEKEERRASVHTMALACVALEAQKDKNLPRTVTKTVTVTASPTGPTTPDLYPDLKSLCAHAASDNTDQIKTSPQYTVSTPQGIQAPVINVREQRAITTQAGASAPIAITTRKSDGTKSQLSGGPVSPDPDLAGSRERADMSTFKLKVITLNLRQTAQVAVQTEDSASLDEIGTEEEACQDDYHPDGIPSAYAMPLVAKSDGKQVYQPFSFTDMNSILEKMPAPTAGGGKWMDRFSQLTNDWTLCMGDWRGLIGHQLPTHEQQRIELAANTVNTPDDQLFCPMATRLGRVMRNIYPVPDGALHFLSFVRKEGESVPEFLMRCRSVWTEMAGSPPTQDKFQTSLFRKAILDGMPKVVQGKMRDNPDLICCDTDQWEKHLTHFVHQEEEKQKDLESDQATKKAQLLNIQLERERRMLNESKKPLKQSSQMLQQPRAQQGQLQQQPMVPPAPAYPPVQDMYAQPPRQTGRGGNRGRGRGNRPRDPRDQCYVCGRMGHWARNCRTSPQNNYPQ